jgi:hypothetical protein
MARPQRNNVDYFPLYVNNGRKMFFIEQKYGNDGYATWLKILSELAKADYHYLNLKDETQLMFLSALCRVGIDTLNNIINDLVKLDEFNKELWNEKILFSEKFVASISDAYLKRSNEPVNLLSLEILLKGLGILKQSFNILKVTVKTHTKEEDIKLKDKIVIPNFDDFSKYVKEKCPEYGLTFDLGKLRAKYDSWVTNGWKDGNDKAIKNWKSKIGNVMTYIFVPIKQQGEIIDITKIKLK